MKETQIATKASALNVMASKVSVEPDKLLNTLKATVFKGASNEELLALVVVANTYGLNPLLKELYAFPAKGGGIVPVVSIDGWISMVNRQKDLDGIEFSMSEDGEECTCSIYIKGRSRPVTVTEYKSECARKTEPWQTMPKRMLRHKALIQAARIAFGFSGIYDEDEAERIKSANARVVESTPQFTPKAAEEPKTAPEAFQLEEGKPTSLEIIKRNLRDEEISESAFLSAVKAKTGAKLRALSELTEAHAAELLEVYSEISAEANK